MSNFEHLSVYLTVLELCKNSVHVDGENTVEKGKRTNPRKKTPPKQMTSRQYSKLQNQNPQLRHHLAPGGI